MIAWEIEDSLQNYGVYQNMFDGRNSHMDSYGTLTDYVKLQEWWKENKDKYSVEEWRKVALYEKGHAYISPNASQLSAFILSQIGELNVCV